MTSPGRVARWLTGQPYLLLCLTALGWAANAIAGRLAVGHISPMAIVCLRWLGVVAVLAFVLRGSLVEEWRRMAPRWRYVFAMGALGYTLFNALFYWAAHHTSAVNLGVVQGVTPALVMAGAFFAYGTPIGRLQIVGLAVSLVGVAVAVGRGDPAVLRTFAFNEGDIGILAASILYAGYTVALRARPKVSPLAFFSAMSLSAFATSLPFLATEIASGNVLWPTPRGWALVAFVALVPSLCSQIFYMRAVELIGPGRAGLFMNAVPVFAALMAVVVLGETFAPYHAVALALVLGGIWLAESGVRPALVAPSQPD